MTRASCVMSSEYLGYFFAVMLAICYMMILMLSIALDPTPMKVYMILILISLLGLIIIIVFLLKKQSYSSRKPADYSLK